MNLALYREFRPSTFKGVIGQDHITRTLSNQVKNKAVTHAYLFTGTRGTGKTSCAKIFSMAINCLSPEDGSPCGRCDVCKALSLPNTDVMEIDAASNNRVDEIRDLREKVKYLPTIANKKVYIIDEVHMLTESAFNALLKTLEEPPEHVVFILATTEVHKLPATILSRCTRFDFRLLTTEELVNHLKNVFDKKGIICDDNSLYLIAGQGAGSVRDTLSIADSVAAFCENNITFDKCLEVLGLSSNDGISALVKGVIDNDIKQIFASIKNVLNRGKNISLLCKEIAEYFKNMLLVKAGVTDINTLNIMPNELELLKEQASKLDEEVLKIGFDKFARIELDLKYSINPQNLFESVCISLLNSPKKLERLERLGVNGNNGEASDVKKAVVNNLEPQTVKDVGERPQVSDSNRKTDNLNIINKNEIEGMFERRSMEPSSSNPEIDRLWGNVLIKIKEKNMFALSASLRDVYGVKMVGNTLILKTNDQNIFKTIDDPSRLDVILNISSSLNSDIKKVEIQYDENNKSSRDIVADLKNIFMDKLKVKE